MAAKRVCAGVIVNPKSSKLGQPCTKWAVKGSDFCAVHGGVKDVGLGNPDAFQNRCTAHSSRTGEQCKNPAIKGGTVCRIHGGSAAHVAKKARERFNELIDPMITIAERQAQRALAGSMSDSDALALVKFIADRTGYTPGHTVEVDVRPWEVTMQHVFKQVGADPSVPVPIIRDAPKELGSVPASAQGYEDPDDIEDAEVVEDNPIKFPEPYPAQSPLPFKIPRGGSSDPPERYRR